MTVQYKHVLRIRIGTTEDSEFDLRNKALKQIQAHYVLRLLSLE